MEITNIFSMTFAFLFHAQACMAQTQLIYIPPKMSKYLLGAAIKH